MTRTERGNAAQIPPRNSAGLKAFRQLAPDNRLALAVLNRRLAALPAGVPHTLILGLTRRCQLRCAHCRYLQPPYNGPVPPDMSPALARRALRLAAAAGIPRIIFFGGEPTLYARLPELVREAAGLGLFAEMDTNGLLLLDPRLLRRLRAAGLAAVRISLHAAGRAAHDARAGPGTFDKAGKALKAARRAGLLVYLSSCVFSGSGGGRLPGLLRFAKASGAHGVRLLPYSGAPGAAFHPAALFTKVKAASPDRYARTCLSGGTGACAAAAREILYIDQRGAIKSCPYSGRTLGSIKTASLAPVLRRRRTGRALFPCRQAA